MESMRLLSGSSTSEKDGVAMADMRLRKHRSRFALAVMVLIAAACVAQSHDVEAPPIPADHNFESYVIYSLILPGVILNNPHSSSVRRVAIADTTVTVDEIGPPANEPERELPPPAGSEQAFYQTLIAFRAERQERVRLQHQFRIETPYDLADAEQAAAFRKNPASYASLILFSKVYFNTAQTAALVYVDAICPHPCSAGQWVFLEKQGGQWMRRAGSIADRADTYAIYSLLLRDDPYPGLPRRQGTLAIAGATINITDMSPAIAPDGQLSPPSNNATAFEEAVEDFRTRRFERTQLSRSFQLSSDYTLLTPAEVQAYRSTQTGYPAINFFSEVYFNTRQTAALVYRSVFCGHLCANGQWIYLEKRGKQWVRRSGLNT